jgi:hypothetical protein
VTEHDPERPGRSHMTIPLLAGWVFADLFVVLFIISLATFTPPAAPRARPSATVTPSASPAHRAAQAAQAAGLNQKPYTVCLRAQVAQGGDAAMDTALDAQLPTRKARAGFVLVYAPIVDGNLGAATSQANSLVSYLLGHDRIFARASGEGGGHGNPKWEFQIFFFSQPSGPSGGQSCG